MDRRVVVTGLGVISSIGFGKEFFWEHLTKGESGIKKVTMFDTSSYNRHYAGEITDFNPLTFIPPNINKFIGRASQFAIAATKLAIEDASLSAEQIRKAGIFIGTTLPEGTTADFSSKMFLNENWDELSHSILLTLFPPCIPRNIGYFFNTTGLNMLIPTACAAGNYTIGYGFDLIKNGEIDIAITGGAESISRLIFQGFQRLYAMAPETCSPFDKNRKGMLLGEGAGILILESLDNANERNAKIYAEISGYGLSCDAGHITIPNKEGIKKSMQKAIKNSNITENNVDYICAHGTGTPANDKAESTAINEIFGEKSKKIAVSSIKSMLGHCMGAASSIEAVACCMALKTNRIPPTINYETPDPECDIDCVPNHTRNKRISTVINNGFAFGGNNCSTVFRKLN